MRTLCLSAVLVLSACLSATARGDGLFYRLPKDGVWVEYELKGTEINPDGSKHEDVGTLTVSCVGSETVDGEKCRWIEIKAETKRENVEVPARLWKMLIPEKQLVQGKSPYQHIVKVWAKRGDQPERKIDKRRLEIVQLFLMGPPEHEKKLAPEKIKSGLGPLDCVGLAGDYLIEPPQNDESGRHAIESAFKTRIHSQAPFGVVWSYIEAQADDPKSGEPGERTIFTLRLSSHGEDATSDLPHAD